MQYDDILLFGSLLKKLFSPGCSKMSLPSPKRLRASRQMLVEPSEIPFAGAHKTLRVASRRIRSDCLPRRRVGEPTRGVLQGKRRRRGFFSNLFRGVVDGQDRCKGWREADR